MLGTAAEYRCPTCNRLLFRGTILLGTAEIKCLRCGVIRVLRELNNDLFDENSFGVLVNREGDIVNACVNASRILGYPLPEILRMRAEQVSPVYTEAFIRELTDAAAHGPEVPHRYGAAFCTTKSGGLKRFSAEHLPLATKGIPYIFTIFTRMAPAAGESAAAAEIPAAEPQEAAA